MAQIESEKRNSDFEQKYKLEVTSSELHEFYKGQRAYKDVPPKVFEKHFDEFNAFIIWAKTHDPDIIMGGEKGKWFSFLGYKIRKNKNFL